MSVLDARSDAPFVRSALANRYELLGLLGSGGMGAVYLARDAELGELVAVKMIHPELARDESTLAHFRNEVRLARRVTHVNVARTFDIGEHDGARFLTMQYVDGEALSAILAREAPLATGRLLRLADDICAGLAAAHEAGVIHRDLKPQNVLVSRESGRAVITDFGIALSASEVQQTLGDVVGTPMYMAPEQLRGETVDARSDVFSFGAMLFVMATGRRPFQPNVARTADTPTPDPRWIAPSIPTALGDLIVRCMARDPAERFASASELRRELERTNASAARVSLVPDPVRERRLIRAVREERLRSVALAPIPTIGLAATYGEGLRALLLARLAEHRELQVVLQENATTPAESVLRASLESNEGRLCLSLTVESRDGYQVLAEKLRGSSNELLVLADDAAAVLVRALAMPGRQVPSSAVVQNHAAADLYLRARVEQRGFFSDAVTRAIALYEQADALSPNHPLVLSGLAVAHARRCWFDGSGLEAARRAAARAIVHGPDRAEAYLGAATVALQANSPAETATALARALSIAPGLVEAQVALARLFGEIGAPADAITLAKNALARSPTAHDAWPELIRLYGLLGDYESAEKTFAAVDERSPAWLIAATGRARIAPWRRDDDFLQRILPVLEARFGNGSALVFVATLAEIRSRRRAPETLEGYESMLPASATPRRKAHHFQLVTETHAAIGDATGAIEALERSAGFGLCDALWLARCPVLDVLRGGRRFEALHDEVRTRALAGLAAFDAMDGRPTSDASEAGVDLGEERTAVQTRR